jgi:hypothetical protein
VSLPDYADMAVCGYCGCTLAREQVRVLAKEREQQLERQPLRSVKCSQCAGPLSAWEGKRILVCDHCGVRVAVLDHGDLSRWCFPARIDATQAATAGAAWLRDHPGIASTFREAALVETKLAFAPIWEHKVLAAGWEFGYRHRVWPQPTVNPLTGEFHMPTDMRPVQERVHEPRLHERRFYLPATDFGVLGAVRPRVTGRELLLPLLAGELDPTAIVLEATGDISEAVEMGRAAARLPLSGASDPDLHIYLFREASSLLYYPLWLLRYRRGNDYGRIVVDGRNGTINSATAPADLRAKTAALVAKISGLIVLAAVLLYLGVAHEAGRGPLLIVAVVVSVLAVVLGLRFRPEKEVEYHDSLAS